MKDTDLKAIIELLENKPYSLGKNSLDGYFLKDGVLYVTDDNEQECLVVPVDERQQLLWEFHSAPTGGHFGWKKMSSALKKEYFWPFMTREIKIYCQMCKACAARSGQGRRPHPHLRPIPITDEPMERVGMDVLKLPLSESGNAYVLVLQDYLTKFLFAYPIPRETAQVIGKTLVNKFFWAFGLPRELLTDRGSAFISDLFQQLEACYEIKHLFTTSCHPQTDGLVERANRTLVNSMAKLLAEYDSTWEDLLGSFLLSYNMSVHASTLISPYAAMFGREGRRLSASLLSKRPSPYAWSLEHWIDQLPHYLRRMWKVVKENAQKAQRL
ncbi:MAG: transposase family protein, partial [Gammaproteobacteria bacterium]|nr:transposase family protein [Gammaproteobacteria bacterium]